MIIQHIYISPQHNFYGHHGQPPGSSPSQSVAEVECVAGAGLRGDRFFNYKEDYKGQVTFFAIETYEMLCQQLHVSDKDPSVFRRNIVTRGTDLRQLIGQEFEVQGIRFLGTQESSPCHWMDEAFAPGAEEAMKGLGGLRAKVLTSGILRISSPA
jgi:MOSC domain-containing protein YiiM